MQTFSKGQMIVSAGEEFHKFYIITKGSVAASFDSSRSFLLKKGDIIGICDFGSPVHSFSYKALEDTQVMPYGFRSLPDFMEQLSHQRDVCHLLNLSMIRMVSMVIRYYKKLVSQCDGLYQYLKTSAASYQRICQSLELPLKALPGKELLQALPLEESPADSWMEEYYHSMKTIVMKTEDATLHPAFVSGFLVKGAKDIGEVIEFCQGLQEYLSELSQLLLNDTYLDLFDLNTDLLFRAKKADKDISALQSHIDKMISLMQNQSFLPGDLVAARVKEYQEKLTKTPEEAAVVMEEDLAQIEAKLARSLDIILEYSDTMDVTAGEFRKYVKLYKDLPDKNSLDKDAERIRKQLTKLFYIIYTEVFQMCLKDPTPPIVIRMFLNFGFVDPELAGGANAAQLYTIANTYHGDPEHGIYTFYEWIHEIYNGRKQPSRNEFDQDYTAYLHALKVQGKIDATAEKELLTDNMNKVMYELENVFPTVNKVTYGRITTYCPVFAEENVLKSLDTALVTPERLLETMEKLRAIDFSVFYRSTLYQDEKTGLRENVIQDIAPDFILMPNVGSHGLLWQEIEGRYRSTPGRMVLSIFHVESMEKTMVQMMGAFRWELCKRIQGARWNDVTEHSLTSEYCDYAQFYAKNRLLSPEAKEKLKLSLRKAKNSYKNLFVMDYTNWILFEATGAAKLNKVARGILAMYCPFPAELRESKKNNALFAEALSIYEIKKNQQLHRLHNIAQKFQAQGKPVPEMIETQIQMLDR